MLKVKILGEMFREAGTVTRCFIKDLNALDCRRGCMVCVLEKIAKRMKEGFPSIEEGPGMFRDRDLILKAPLNMTSDNRMSTLRDMAEILEKCDSVAWLVTDEQIVSILEFLLWDSVRLGISLHLSGTSPCLLFDLERLLTLTKNALGKRLEFVRDKTLNVKVITTSITSTKWPRLGRKMWTYLCSMMTKRICPITNESI